MGSLTKRIANHRVRILFVKAMEVINEDPNLALRYTQIARRVAMGTKTRFPQEFRIKICRHCKQFIFPGVNSRIRINQHRETHVTITCFNCLKYTRIKVSKKQHQSM